MTSSSKSKYLQIKNYILKEDIGEGNFGKVKLGVSKTTNEEYAIKIINKDQIKIKMKNKIFRENEVITKFNHINVIFVFEIIEDPENYYIIMEYCKKGELFDYIVDNERLTEDEAAIFFYQLINGVEYIHSKGIAHRDLKPENLLLTKDKTLKIIDFGLSHEFNGNNLLKTKCGSPSYASPEILRGKPYDGFKSDIWSCGIILYAMVCGYLPFDGDTNKILFKNIMKCQPEIPDFLNDITQDLIIRILTSEPEERITIDEIKKHRFYLRGKKLCHIDYKMIEKNILKKRKNKSSFRLNPDDNNYYLAINDNIDEDKKNNEEKLMNEIINMDKEIEENNRVIKTENTGINNKILLNEDIKELLDNKNSKSNSSNNLNVYREKKDNNENKYYDKIEVELKEKALNDEQKKETQKQINEIDTIFLSKRNNYEKINNFADINNLKIKKNEEITHKNIYLNDHNKSNKLNKFLDNIRKKMHINTFDNESKLKTLKILDSNDKNPLQYKSPDKLILNKYTPTIVINDINRKHKLNINQNNHNNQIFATIKHSFNKNIFNNSKKYIVFNNYNLNKNRNISIEHNSNNILYKKSPDKISLNSINQIKLINPKNDLNKDNQNLYYNNINININNYNIKSGNKKKDNYMKNYINTENELKYKIGKHSISNLHNSKKLYLNTENNKDIFRRGNNENILFSKNNDNNKERMERKIPSKTQENFFKPKKSYNFDKISFHTINNRKLKINKNNDIKNNILGIDNKNELLKIRSGSEGKGIKNSYLDNFLNTINSNGIYKNRNKKIYFCGPINIKVSNNNYNLNNSQKYKFLPFMAQK